MLFVFAPDGAVFSDMFFFSVGIVGFSYGLRGRVVAKQIIGCNTEIASDTQKLVLANGAIAVLDAAQGALVDAYDIGEFALLHIIVGSEVGNSFANLLIAQKFTPQFCCIVKIIIEYSDNRMCRQWDKHIIFT